MPAANASTIATLVVELTGDGEAYLHELSHLIGGTESLTHQLVKSFEIAAAGIVASVTAIVGLSIKEYADFEVALVDSTANMTGATEQMRQEMLRTAITLSDEGKGSAEELAKAYGALRVNGKDASQAIKDIGVADEFAISTHRDAVESTMALARAQVAVGLASKDATEDMEHLEQVSDVITKASQIGNSSQMAFAGALAESGIQIRMLSGGLTEGAAILATYTKQGKDAGTASTNLNMMLRTLEQSATHNKQVWEAYGISVYDSNGKLKPLADIIKQLERNFVGLTDQQQRQELADLGFQARTLLATKSLIGMSSTIREFQTDLENAGGATEKVANQQLATFDAQIIKAYNNLKNILVVIGSELVPVLEQLNRQMAMFNSSTNATSVNVHDLADFMRDALVTAIGLVGDAFHGLVFIWKIGQASFAGMIAMTTSGLLALAETTDRVLNGIYSTMQRIANVLVEATRISVKPSDLVKAWNAPTESLSAFGAQVAVLKRASAEADQEVIKLWQDATNYADRATAAANKLTTSLGVQTTVTAQTATTTHALYDYLKAIEDEYDDLINNTATYNRLLPETYQLQKDIAEAWEVDSTKIKEYNVALASGQVTLAQYTMAMEKLHLKGMAEDPFEKAMVEVMHLDAAFAHGIITINEYQAAVTKAMTGANPLLGQKSIFGDLGGKVDITADAMGKSGIGDQDALHSIEKEKAIANQKYLVMKEAADKELKLLNFSEAQKSQIMLTMERTHLLQTKNYEAQRMSLLLNSAQQIGDSLTSMAEMAGGKQSGVYKAMFAASKAFAIADSIIKIQQGIANAVSLGWPAMIPAIASVVAASANIVSSIQAVALNFEGGGDTPDGARIGGLDGKGGMLAMVHPKERIIDKTRSSSTGDSPAINVQIINQTDAQVTTMPTDDGKGLRVLIKRMKQEIAADVRNGGGIVSDAFETSYANLLRGQRGPR